MPPAATDAIDLVEQPTLDVVPDWTLGERFRKARRHLGLTQQQLADAIGVPVGRWSSYESDASLPRDVVGTAREVARVTGFPVEWLLGLRSRCYALPPLEGQGELFTDAGAGWADRATLRSV